MRLLHILYPGQGGLGTYFLNFVKDDTNKRFRHYAVFYGVEPLYPEYDAFCKEHNILFICLRRSHRFDLSYFSKIWGFIKEHSIETVLLHTFSVAPLLIFGKQRTRWIIVDHTSRPFKSVASKIWFFVLQFIADATVLFYDNQEKIFFNKQTVLVLPKSVQTHAFKPKLNKVNSVSTIGMASRFVKGKHQNLIIRAIANLKQNEIQLTCIFAGDGELKKDCMELANLLEVGELIEFKGILGQESMPDFYNSLDAYVHASDGETICYSIMEAQACGLPILASDVKGINSVLNHKFNALLFANTIQDIADTLIEINENEMMQKLAEESIRVAHISRTFDLGSELLFQFVKKKLK